MTDPADRKTRKRPSAALVVALLALFASLSGTAVAAGVVPLAKRAILADTAKNSLKLGGLTPQQVGSLAPPPNIYYITKPWTLSAGSDTTEFTVSCDQGEKVLSGGYDNSGDPQGNALAQDTHPTADGTGWVIDLQDLSPSSDTAGNLYAVCLR